MIIFDIFSHEFLFNSLILLCVERGIASTLFIYVFIGRHLTAFLNDSILPLNNFHRIKYAPKLKYLFDFVKHPKINSYKTKMKI